VQRDRTLALLFATGTVLGLLAAVLPHPHGVNTRAVAITTGVGPPVAIGLWLRAGRVPLWVFHGLLVGGVVVVSVGSYFAGGGAATANGVVGYVIVVAYASLLFSLTVALAYFVLVGVAYAVLLVVLHEQGGPSMWVVLMGAGLVNGVIVGFLVHLVRALAATDSLTGLPNRRILEQTLSRELARSVRGGTPLSLVIIDLDDFKRLNDTAGHQAGDRLLCELANAWTGELRGADLLARYGGDEFALLLPDCAAEAALEILDRLRSVTPLIHTFSAGVAVWDGSAPPDQLFAAADVALLGAKGTGRSQTRVSASEDAGPT